MIYHIDQVIPHIENHEGFIVAKRDNYDVVNYVSVVDAFPKVEEVGEGDAVRRECRGMIFDKQGKIVRRPFHKFFNVGERLETHESKIDWTRKHVYLDKLDGSMVTPFLDKGQHLRWATKMGITEVAMQAEVHVAKNQKYIDFATACLDIPGDEVTPIFEWCSRKQRIVVDYPEDQLILTGMRALNSGYYYPYDSMKRVATNY